MPSFVDLLGEHTTLLADGATGTNYQNMGIEPGVAPEEWVLDSPDRVRELHRRFADAGSDLVLTCTFGATTPRLADGPLAGRTIEVNTRAAALALEGVQSATDLPLVASFSFDQGTHTMMGLSPTQVVAAVEPLGVAALGANCGRSLVDTDAIVEEF